MKKLSAIFPLIVLVIGLGIRLYRCENENVSQLREAIEVSNSQCPQNLGMMGDLLSLKFDEKSKEVQAYFLLNENLLNIDVLKNNKKLVSQSMKLSFSKSESQELINLVAQAGASLSMTLKGGNSGKTLKITFTKDDLKSLGNNPLSESDINKLLLENQIAIVNSSCPYPVEYGVEMEKVYDEGSYVIYACRIDENLFDMAQLRTAQNEIKDNVKGIFEDPSVKGAAKLMVALGKGLIYRYYGELSGESVDIVFDVDELDCLVR
jgi:hypothetical protein